MEMEHAESTLRLYPSAPNAWQMKAALQESKRMLKEHEAERASARHCSAKELETRMDDLLNEPSSVFVYIVEGQVSVFTKNLGTQFPPQFLKKCRDMLRVERDTTVAWYQSVNSLPLEVRAATALYGQLPDRPPTKLVIGNKLQVLRSKSLSSHKRTPECST
jgi:hypothetical protein